MKTLKVFDSKDYSLSWTRYKRDSVKAIIFQGGKLAMLRSEKFGEYEFPGGGIEAGESHLEALIREVKEETGLHIIPASVKEYGRVNVTRKGFKLNEIYEQELFYYFCDVEPALRSEPCLNEGYETEFAYRLTYISLEEAARENEKRQNIPNIPWVKRELFVLNELIAVQTTA